MILSKEKKIYKMECLWKTRIKLLIIFYKIKILFHIILCSSTDKFVVLFVFFTCLIVSMLIFTLLIYFIVTALVINSAFFMYKVFMKDKLEFSLIINLVDSIRSIYCI
ncbi:hypothetical protein B8T70_08125 [Flavobacterium sp. AJR]|nr:hypothetical protein B8T70_08125 [Flavobacterium sp. AJR]